MNASEYQKQCRQFDNHHPSWTTPALALGLVAEAGEVANEIERSYRLPLRGLNRGKIALELGDVLWNAARLADELGYGLEELMQMNIDKLTARYEERGLEIK